MRFTKRQKQILDYIREHLATKGYAPSMREIAAHFGLSSVATVHQHITALEKMDVLSKDWNRSRSIRPAHMDLAAVVEVPILGNIAAGLPIPAVETRDDLDTVAMPENFLRHGEHFALRVEGDSMIDEGIHDGDILIIRRQSSAENGQVVVALVDEAETTVKKIQKHNGFITLVPANPAFESQVYESHRVGVQGIVVSLMRRYH